MAHSLLCKKTLRKRIKPLFRFFDFEFEIRILIMEMSLLKIECFKHFLLDLSLLYPHLYKEYVNKEDENKEDENKEDENKEDENKEDENKEDENEEDEDFISDLYEILNRIDSILYWILHRKEISTYFKCSGEKEHLIEKVDKILRDHRKKIELAFHFVESREPFPYLGFRTSLFWSSSIKKKEPCEKKIGKKIEQGDFIKEKHERSLKIPSCSSEDQGKQIEPGDISCDPEICKEKNLDNNENEKKSENESGKKIEGVSGKNPEDESEKESDGNAKNVVKSDSKIVIKKPKTFFNLISNEMRSLGYNLLFAKLEIYKDLLLDLVSLSPESFHSYTGNLYDCFTVKSIEETFETSQGGCNVYNHEHSILESIDSVLSLTEVLTSKKCGDEKSPEIQLAEKLEATLKDSKKKIQYYFHFPDKNQRGSFYTRRKSKRRKMKKGEKTTSPLIHDRTDQLVAVSSEKKSIKIWEITMMSAMSAELLTGPFDVGEYFSIQFLNCYLDGSVRREIRRKR